MLYANIGTRGMVFYRYYAHSTTFRAITNTYLYIISAVHNMAIHAKKITRDTHAQCRASRIVYNKMYSRENAMKHGAGLETFQPSL